ncbi:hypothetical protein ACTFIR_003003 [Dictyostelium discoideum]
MEIKDFNIECDNLKIEENEFSKGSFAKVYKGSYYGNPVCVKVIKKDTLIDKESWVFLKREIGILKNLLNQGHKNIIRFIGIGEKDSLLFLVTELINGGDLGNILLDHKFHIPWSLRVKIAKDIAEGMEYLHSKQIMHRDLKSNNLLLGRNWTIKICDFGFAKEITIQNPLSMTICGTDEFMSPEVILGIQYSYSADIYSFGMVLLELITRNKLDERLPQNNFDIDYEELQNKIPSECPREFLELSMKCCNYDPNDRPSFTDIVQTLDQLAIKLIKETPDGPYPSTPIVVSNPHFDDQSINDWCMLSLIPDDCLENLNEFAEIENNINNNNNNNNKNNNNNNNKNNNINNNNNCKVICENCASPQSTSSVNSSFSNSSLGSNGSNSSGTSTSSGGKKRSQKRKSWKCLIN